MSKWILYDADHIGTTNCKCPVCKTEFFFPRIAVDPYRYCPNCGQFMDDTCENCKYKNYDVHSKPCVDCEAGNGRPTNWQAKEMPEYAPWKESFEKMTDCQW